MPPNDVGVALHRLARLDTLPLSTASPSAWEGEQPLGDAAACSSPSSQREAGERFGERAVPPGGVKRISGESDVCGHATEDAGGTSALTPAADPTGGEKGHAGAAPEAGVRSAAWAE